MSELYKYCAKVIDGVVEMIIVCHDIQWAVDTHGGDWVPVYEDNYCGLGWTWDGERFTPPKPEE